MRNKRRFTNEEIEELVKRSEGISIGQLAREIGVNKSTLQSNINRYKKDKKHKEQVAEMKAKGMEMLDISKELDIGLEEVEGIIAALEGREPRMITRNWTLEQKEQMYQMKCDNIPVSEIARVFNTTEMKVYKTIEMYVAKKNKKVKKKQESKYIPTVKPKAKVREKYKGPSIAELNKQAKMHNLTYGQYIAMKEMGLCQES